MHGLLDDVLARLTLADWLIMLTSVAFGIGMLVGRYVWYHPLLTHPHHPHPRPHGHSHSRSLDRDPEAAPSAWNPANERRLAATDRRSPVGSSQALLDRLRAAKHAAPAETGYPFALPAQPPFLPEPDPLPS